MENLSIYIAIFGLALSAATFFIGRLSSASSKGEKDGNVMTKLDTIGQNIEKIDGRLSGIETQMGQQRDRITRLETRVDIYHGSKHDESTCS